MLLLLSFYFLCASQFSSQISFGSLFETKNWKPLAPGVDLGGSKFSRSEFSRFGWTEFLGLRSEV